MPGRARSPGAPIRTRGSSAPGGCAFAEDPARAAPHARIIWQAALDPGTLAVAAAPAAPGDPDGFDAAALAPWLTVSVAADGREHAVLSDGFRRIRLDVEAGSLHAGVPVILHYRLHGLASAGPRLLPLRRLLHLCRHRRFSAALFPAETGVPRGLELLRVHDALRSGASQREIAAALYGAERVAREWNAASDALRSRVRRLAVDARAMARGAWRGLLRQRHR